jgi:hypothetical protein
VSARPVNRYPTAIASNAFLAAFLLDKKESDLKTSLASVLPSLRLNDRSEMASTYNLFFLSQLLQTACLSLR